MKLGIVMLTVGVISVVSGLFLWLSSTAPEWVGFGFASVLFGSGLTIAGIVGMILKRR